MLQMRKLKLREVKTDLIFLLVNCKTEYLIPGPSDSQTSKHNNIYSTLLWDENKFKPKWMGQFTTINELSLLLSKTNQLKQNKNLNSCRQPANGCKAVMDISTLLTWNWSYNSSSHFLVNLQLLFNLYQYLYIELILTSCFS